MADADVVHDERPNVWERFARFLVRRAGLVNFVSLASFAAAAYGLVWFQTETKVIRYFPPHTRVFQDYKALEDSLAGIVSVEVLVQFPQQPEIDLTEATDEEVAAAAKQLNVLQRMEIVRRIEGKLANHPGVSGTISLADFRPVSPEPGTPRYIVTVRKTEKAIFDEQADETQSFAQRVTKPLSVESHGRKIAIGEGDELWRIRCQTAILNDVSFSELVGDLQSIVAAEVAQEHNVQFVLTGMIPLFLRTQEALLTSLIQSFVLAFGLIALIMIVLLKHPVSGLLAMLPNIYPVGIVFGLVAWAAIPVDIGTMITASVALGIAIDGTLHLITWFQEGIRDGLSREEAVIKSLKHCGPAMWQTSAAISIGMVLLFGADLLLISRFGWLMAGLVMVALIGDIVLLPALLAGWMGAIIERTIQKEPKVAGASIALEPALSGVEAESGVVSIPLPPHTEQSAPQRRMSGFN
jgi:predicted RND superfamily exporter protein